MAVGAHHHEVDAEIGRRREQHVADADGAGADQRGLRRRQLRDRVMGLGLDPVLGQVGGDVGGGDVGIVGRVDLIDNHLRGAREQRQGVVHGAAGLAGAVPGH